MPTSNESESTKKLATHSNVAVRKKTAYSTKRVFLNTKTTGTRIRTGRNRLSRLQPAPDVPILEDENQNDKPQVLPLNNYNSITSSLTSFEKMPEAQLQKAEKLRDLFHLQPNGSMS